MAKALPAYGEQQVNAWQDLGAFVGVNYYLVQGREVQIHVDVHARMFGHHYLPPVFFTAPLWNLEMSVPLLQAASFFLSFFLFSFARMIEVTP